MSKEGRLFFDFIFINRVRAFHHFTIKRLILSFSSFVFKSFLFIKKMDVNEFIQFVKSCIFVFMNIDNSENELVSYIF